MLNLKFQKANKIFFFIDVVVMLLLLNIFLKLQYKYFYPTKLTTLPNLGALIDAHYKAVVLLLISWFVIADYIKFYQIKRAIFMREILKKIFFQTFFFLLIIFSISGIKKAELLSNKLILIFSIILIFYLLFTRLFIFFLRRYYFKRGRYLKNVLVVGENSNTNILFSILKGRKDFGYNIIKNTLKFDVETFDSFIKLSNIEEVFISQLGGQSAFVENYILSYCEKNHIEINYIPYTIDKSIIGLKLNYIDTLPIFKIKKYPLDKTSNQIVKYWFDIILSILILILILSWLFPIIAILIKLDSKGPVFFKQERRGFNGKKFKCYKFRTMRNDGTNSIIATITNDNRVTKIGSILRKTSFDELPQIFNVLKGDMSIIGPRPHFKTHDDYCRELIKNYDVRHKVRPGITGLAQVKGFRGAINSDRDFENRVRTDIFYVRNWSLLLDLQIIYQTVELIFKGDENAI